METFRVQDEDGNSYDIEAPDQASAVAAYKKMKAGQDPYANRKASFVPFLATDDQGDLTFDITAGFPAAIAKSILSGVTAPGDVVSGKLDPNSPEAIQRAMDFTALASPVNPAIRAGERAIPGVAKALRPAKPKAPTVEALKEASEAGYEAARTMGVDYSADAVKSLADDAARELQEQGILAELTPKTFTILNKLQEPPEGSVASIEGLIAARRALNNAAGDFTNPTERLAANRVVDRLDEFLQGRDASSVVAGVGIGDGGAATAAARAAKLLEDARGDYAAAKRSERVTGAEQRAELNAAVANSGHNVGNQIRQRLRDILTRPKDARGYSPEELQFIEQIARGTVATNTMRHVGNLLGGGGGMHQALTSGLAGAGGYAAGGPGMAAMAATAAPLVGAGLRAAGNNLTKRQVEKLDELIRKRSPLYEQALQNPPMQVQSPEMRAMMLRALMLMRPQEQPAAQ